jgi:hypothetical protein
VGSEIEPASQTVGIHRRGYKKCPIGKPAFDRHAEYVRAISTAANRKRRAFTGKIINTVTKFHLDHCEMVAALDSQVARLNAYSDIGAPSRRCPEQAHQHQHRQLVYIGKARWQRASGAPKQVPSKCQVGARQVPSRCRAGAEAVSSQDEAMPSSRGDARAAKRARTGGAKTAP